MIAIISNSLETDYHGVHYKKTLVYIDRANPEFIDRANPEFTKTLRLTLGLNTDPYPGHKTASRFEDLNKLGQVVLLLIRKIKRKST
ncbi:MAG TPA: hypothetical protein VKA95_09905 [Nitrososphaeraceae archaeon]|nr:hypothetical protein [Nitrososphaeraceae archaeon]